MTTKKQPNPSSGTKTIDNNNKDTIQNKLEAHAKPIVAFLTATIPLVITFCQKLYAFYKTLPEDQLQLLIGFMICFFGGVYPALFAAIEAAKHGGLNKVRLALKDLADEATIIIEASKKDDKVDEDKDGKADVEKLDAKALLMRKANLVVTKMNPQKVCVMCGDSFTPQTCMYHVCIFAYLF